jgi:hypothetical protein
MHLPINVKSPTNISKWQVGFNSAFKGLKKTQKATKCSDNRTIRLIAHIAQIVSRIIRVGIEMKIEDILGEDLFGFKRRKGTTDGIGMTMMLMLLLMMMISERTYGQGIVCVLTEWQMALERVNWTKLMQMVKETGIN